MNDERGGIVKTLLIIAVIGVILFDAGAIVFNIFTLDSTADDIANQITLGITGQEANSNQFALKDRAADLAKEADARLTKFSIGTDGIVRITLKRKADTLIVGKIGAIEDWGKATGDGQAATQ